MYNQVQTQKVAQTKAGSFTPMATLRDQYGGVAHIGVDDSCYVIYIEKDGIATKTYHIFKEIHEVMSNMPSPEIMQQQVFGGF